uniref:rRNA methyltransferase 1, mitochondrial n=1 Tax=Opuntia streptacantha TaxID=393608 RepID=A0A7C9AQ69_OPUST
MALRVSSPKSTCSKLQSFSQRVSPKPSLIPSCTMSAGPSCRFEERLQSVKPIKISFSLGGFCVGFALPGSKFRGIRDYSNLSNANQRRGRETARRSLPWLADGNVEDSNRNEKVVKAKASNKSSWEISAEKFLQRSGSSLIQDDEGRRSRVVGDVEEDWRKPRFERDDRIEEDDENKVINDPRWDRIKTRLRPVVNPKRGSDTPQLQRWNRQENWGRKTYREANHESTLPKMVGEGVYGVGPVLAALSAGRREFYTLYVQEGLDLSKNNKKKKDKKGFEKVLKIADKVGLSIKEISKHDLNMVVDNRPHQGLVLDASPLEMVNIRELDPVSTGHDKGVLWVALDEVTDPQNLGAIIRSSYFFGASGVVLCAKNSAPLSGVVSKASAGSLELMEIRSCKNMMQFLTSSAQNGWRVVGGSVSSRAVPLREIVPGEPTILVLGSEGTGLRPLVERSCTQLVRIPGNVTVDVSSGRFDDGEEADVENQSSSEEFRSFMAVESLNVSVAAGVLLHHLIGSYCASDYVPGDIEADMVD